MVILLSFNDLINTRFWTTVFSMIKKHTVDFRFVLTKKMHLNAQTLSWIRCFVINKLHTLPTRADVTPDFKFQLRSTNWLSSRKWETLLQSTGETASLCQSLVGLRYTGAISCFARHSTGPCLEWSKIRKCFGNALYLYF